MTSRKILGTVKKGAVKIYSPRQMAFLHAKKIDHTHYKKVGSRIVKTRHVYWGD